MEPIVVLGRENLDFGALKSPIWAHNTFALSLFSAIAQDNSGQNVLFSPLSIFAALSMVLPGAQKETLQQLLSAMRLMSSDSGQPPLSPAALSQLESALGRMLAIAAPAGDGGQRQSGLLSANRAFVEAGLEVRPAFLAALRDRFNATVLKANFSRDPKAERLRINEWIAATTRNKITDLLQSGSINPLTQLVLANALYFKGKWAVPFDPKSTMDAPFELSASAAPISVPMMRSELQRFRVVSIPDVLIGVRFDFNVTGSQRMSMLAVLPEQRHGLDALMADMSETDWHQLVNNPGQEMKVYVSLPKVKLASKFELSDYLPMLNITNLFVPGLADLSGIAGQAAGDLWVSSFAHQATLEWDEFGAEGSAASAAVIVTRMAPKLIIFDQPFIVIVSSQVADADGKLSQVPIFIGRVSDPRG